MSEHMASNQAIASGEGQATTSATEPNTETAKHPTGEELVNRLKDVASEAKSYRQKNAELQKQLESIQQKQMSEQGQFRELYETTKTRLSDTEQKLAQAQQAFGYKAIESVVIDEAMKHGCRDTETLMQVMPIEEIPIGDNFKVDRDAVRLLLDDMKKNKPYFFKNQAAPNVSDVVPKPQTTEKKLDLTKLSPHELAHLLAASKAK